MILGGIAVLAAAMLSITFGSAKVPLMDVWNAVFHFDSENLQHQIIRDLRIPRTVGDIFVGAAFAVSGAVMQGMTRNPIADTGILGINYGASFALSLCMAFSATVNYATGVVYSLIGAAFATLIVYGLTSLHHGKQTPVRLVLAGTATGLCLSALSQGIAIHFKVAQNILFWTSGGVGSIRAAQLYAVIPFITVALIGAIALSRSISLLSIGEDSAKGLGLHIRRTKGLCMLVVLVLAGAAVALTGPVAFIGLIVPHMVRHLVGTDYRRIIPACILYGAFAVLLADVVSRLINPPHEVPIGIVFAIIGVPFFLYISRQKGGDSHA